MRLSIMRGFRLVCSLLVAGSQLCGCGRSGHPNSNTGQMTNAVPDAASEPIVEPFNTSGFAKIKFRDEDVYKEGVVDASRQEIIPLSSRLLVDDITDSMALIRFERKFLFVPLSFGSVSIDDLESVRGFQYAQPYRCGVALVVVDDVWFYIAPDGQPAFEGRYQFAESFHQDRAYVLCDDEHQIIDPQGNIVARLDYQEVSLQSPYCWQVANSEQGKFRTGFIDLDGHEVSGLIYDRIGYYDADVKRIWVRKDNRYGFVDEYGKVAIPVEYEYAEVFDRGKARVRLNGRDFFIDPDGKEVPD